MKITQPFRYITFTYVAKKNVEQKINPTSTTVKKIIYCLLDFIYSHTPIVHSRYQNCRQRELKSYRFNQSPDIQNKFKAITNKWKIVWGSDESKNNQKELSIIKVTNSPNTRANTIKLEPINFISKTSPAIKFSNKEDQHALYLAIEKGSIDTVKSLIKKGIDLNKPFNNGTSPLCRALYVKQWDIAKLFIQNNVDLSFATKNGYTPLHLASWLGPVEIVQILIEKGADPNICTSLGATPAHFAAESGLIKNLEYLIEHGAKPDEKDVDNTTPLIFATDNGHLDCVKYLIKKNVNLNVKDNYNRTPVHISIEKRESEILKELINNGAKISASADNNGSIPLIILPYLNLFDPYYFKAADKIAHSDLEFLFKKLIVHNLSLSFDVELNSGSNSIIGEIEILKLFENFSNILLEKESKFIKETIAKSIENKYKNNDEIINQFKNNECLHFTTGQQGHILSVIFFQNYMLVVNRDTRNNMIGNKAQSIHVFNIDRKKFTLENEDIQILRGSPAARENTSEKYFYKTLPAKLGYQCGRIDPIKDIIENNIRQSIQKADNCWLIAVKTSILPLLAILRLTASNNINKYESILKESVDVYKQFSQYSKEQLLIEYLSFKLNDNLDSSKIDNKFINLSLKKLLKKSFQLQNKEKFFSLLMKCDEKQLFQSPNDTETKQIINMFK